MQTQLRARFRKRLARESCTQDIVRRHLIPTLADVAERSAYRIGEIQDVKVAKLGVDFRGKNALVAKPPQRLVKSTKPREQINESHLLI
jgi:hypothetical protein